MRHVELQSENRTTSGGVPAPASACHIRIEVDDAESDLKGEYIARETYTKGRDICRLNKDYVSMKLFEELLQDEEGHIDFIETQLELLDKIGEKNYGQLQADPTNELEED